MLAGQPTDDSEMALALARTLTKREICDREAVRLAYVARFESNAFDCGGTVTRVLRDGRPDPESQANGALMRAIGLGIFGQSPRKEELRTTDGKDLATRKVGVSKANPNKTGNAPHLLPP
jgi:ADP-ribosylglycohydrolase